jgi:hypothetical protein
LLKGARRDFQPLRKAVAERRIARRIFEIGLA